MELDERKQKILKAIISNYLETGEPVGSRTISKYTDLNLSSATIRNEMADLEELGLIMQPHTSAGRVPTDQGYRLYVDHMMAEKDNEMQEMKTQLLERVDKMESMLKQVAKVLAYNTNYATLVTAPQYQNKKLKFIQLSQVDDNQLLAVIVVDGNVIRNKMMQVERPLENDELLKLNVLLNTFLQGASLQDINLEMIQTIKAQAGEFADIMENIFQGIAETIHDADEVLAQLGVVVVHVAAVEEGHLPRESLLRGGSMAAVPRGEGSVGVFGEDAAVVDGHDLVHHDPHGLQGHGRIDDRRKGRGERTDQVGVRQYEVAQRRVALGPVLDPRRLDDVADAHVRGA